MAVLLLALPAYAQHKSEAWAKTQFAAAERLHVALEARPAQQLKRSDYERAINAYHRVFYEAPTSTKADPSVVAVAQLMEEMGRRFNDDDILRSAVQQYEFLRRQYPGSKARFNALFRIGEIYKYDLRDQQRGDAVFEEFLRRYPRNQFAEEARKALAEPVEKAALRTPVKPQDRAKAKLSDDDSNDADEDSDDSHDQAAGKKSAVATPPENASPTHVTGIRHWSTPGSTRVAIDLEQSIKFESQRIDNPDRVFFDLYNTKLDHQLVGRSFDLDDGLVSKIRISQFKPGQTRVVLEVNDAADFEASLLMGPPRLMIEVRGKKAAEGKEAVKITPTETDIPAEATPAPATRKSRTIVTTSNGVKKTIVDADDDDPPPARKTVARLDPPETKPAIKIASPAAAPDNPKPRTAKGKKKVPPDPDAREAQPTASGDRSLIRALGLKIGKIVIDPGHGGHDTGTIGPNGLEEKDLVLDVSKRLGKLLDTRLGAEVIYTRDDDTFIPLETRTAIANQEGADLFVSVHANSSSDADARGVETYYLNFTSSAEALEVAARENAVSEKSIHELQDLVKKIALKEKIEESREFATDVEYSLHSGLAAKNPGLRDRGVKKAPFIVLIGANMPSILAEISFVSNPGDERRLGTPEYRQRIAESLYRGIAKYVGGLSGVKVASKIDKGEGR